MSDRSRATPLLVALAAPVTSISAAGMLIDDFSGVDGLSALGTPWRLVSDRVMGGVSDGRMSLEQVGGRRALCLHGHVRLEQNGGFLQLALDLSPAGTRDASGYTGIRLSVRGNGEQYGLHLKTDDVRLPWQSYRQEFDAREDWRDLRLPFSGFAPHRIDVPLDVNRLRRLGLVAIGRAFAAELCVSEIGFY